MSSVINITWCSVISMISLPRTSANIVNKVGSDISYSDLTIFVSCVFKSEIWKKTNYKKNLLVTTGCLLRNVLDFCIPFASSLLITNSNKLAIQALVSAVGKTKYERLQIRRTLERKNNIYETKFYFTLAHSIDYTVIFKGLWIQDKLQWVICNYNKSQWVICRKRFGEVKLHGKTSTHFITSLNIRSKHQKTFIVVDEQWQCSIKIYLRINLYTCSKVV